MQKISRRQFLSLCAGAVVLGGGWVFARGRILPELRDRTAAALGRGRVTYLRQIVAQDNAAARTIMWQSPASLVAPAVELTREGAAEMQRFPAEEEAFTEDGVTVYLYTAQVTGLERGARYRYRVAAGEERGGWTPLQADDGGAFRALIFPDSQSSDYADWRELAQMARQRNPDAKFFINMGDLVDNGEDHTQWNAWLDGVEGIIDTIPIAPLMGNHETYDKQWQVREPVAYLREFALPGNGSKEYDRRYYSFDYGPVHFLVLDTQQGEEQERHPHITEAQEAWFRSDVQRTLSRGRSCSCIKTRCSIASTDDRSVGKVFPKRAKYGCRSSTRRASTSFSPPTFIRTATAVISKASSAVRKARSTS